LMPTRIRRWSPTMTGQTRCLISMANKKSHPYGWLFLNPMINPAT
jgi:hypothetical protein